MPGRYYAHANAYRYGFNGKENDNDVKGEGNQQDYGMRIYDVRLGRFLSVDPITKNYPELTPYQYASNTPIEATDLDGLEADFVNKKTGKRVTGPVYANAFPESEGWVARGAVVHRPMLIFSNVNTTARIPIKEREIMKSNGLGTTYIGPESIVRSNVAISRQNYFNAVGENIAGGPFGAAGYFIGGNQGSFYGAAVDGIAFSFGGIPEQSSVLTKPNFTRPNSTLNYLTLNEHPPLNLTINLKDNWNNEQVTDAYNKAQAITNNPEAKVTIKNPVKRISNLKNIYLKNGGTLKADQHVDHTTDLQLNGTNEMINLNGINGSVNCSFGKQLNLLLKNVPDNTKVNTVSINPFGKGN